MTLLVFGVALAVFCVAAMALAWQVVITSGRSGWTDVFWSLTVGIAGTSAALWPFTELGPRNWLVAVLVVVWSGRLAGHIARRTLRGGDDPRYAELRRGWGASYRPQLFLFLQVQAAVALVLALAVMAAAGDPGSLHLGDALGVLIAMVAIGGEATADRQLRRFGRNPGNRGQVCATGLWAWCRHPNYLFELLFWVSFVPIGIGHAWGWLAVAAPLMMFVLLRHVSGVPPLERHLLKSRAAYSAYQQRVPAFWPRIPSA